MSDKCYFDDGKNYHSKDYRITHRVMDRFYEPIDVCRLHAGDYMLNGFDVRPIDLDSRKVA